MFAKLIVLVLVIQTSDAFTCPSANGTYVNPDDYRSYYVCSNRCPMMKSCQVETAFFTRINQTCVEGSVDWMPTFDLTGEFKSAENAYVTVQQDMYNLYIVHETASRRYELHARYINQTHAIGIQTLQMLTNNCIVVFNTRVVATRNRRYCYYETLHPYSTMCNLPNNYSGNYCKTY